MTITVFPYPQAHRAAIAAAGSDAARCAASSGRIGSDPYLSLRKDGTKRVEIRFAGTLPVVGDYIEIPASYVSLLLLQAATKSPGNWEVWIESADRSNRLRGVLNATDMVLSGDIKTGDGFDIAPGSWRIGFTAPSPVTPAAILSPTDHRVRTWLDPRFAWAAMPTDGQYQANTQGSVRNIPEPGIPYPGDGYAIQRLAHSFKYRIGPSLVGFEGANFRAGAGDGSYWIQLGTTYWLAFSYKPNAGMVSAGLTAFSIFDMHVSSNGPYPAGPGPFQIWNSGTGTFDIVTQAGNGGVLAGTVVRATETMSAGNEYAYVIQMRMDPTGVNALLKIWRWTNGASKTLRVNTTAAYGFAGINDYFGKQVVYHYPSPWGSAWAQPVSDISFETKCYLTVRDEAPNSGEPTITEDVMYSTLAAV